MYLELSEKIQDLKRAQGACFAACLIAMPLVILVASGINHYREECRAQAVHVEEFWRLVEDPSHPGPVAEKLLAKDVSQFVKKSTPGSHLFVSGDSSNLFSSLDPEFQARYHVKNGIAWTVQYDDRLEVDAVNFRNGGIESLSLDTSPPMPVSPNIVLASIASIGFVAWCGLGFNRISVRRRLARHPYAKELAETDRLLAELDRQLAAPRIPSDKLNEIRRKKAELESKKERIAQLGLSTVGGHHDVISRSHHHSKNLDAIIDAHEEASRI